MFKGSRKYWTIAILCGVAAAVLFSFYMQQVKERYQPDDLITVVRAKMDISRDTVVETEMVQIVKVPAKYTHPDALREQKDVVGKIAVNNIAAGEDILAGELLSSENSNQRLAYQVPRDKRAVSIGINDISGVAGYIEAGDRVDIMATVDVSSQGEEATCTVLALQDVPVLAVGASGTNLKEKGGESLRTLTLAVSPEEAQPLVLASERGTLRLMLRSPVDHGRSMLPPLQLNSFLQSSQ